MNDIAEWCLMQTRRTTSLCLFSIRGRRAPCRTVDEESSQSFIIRSDDSQFAIRHAHGARQSLVHLSFASGFGAVGGASLTNPSDLPWRLPTLGRELSGGRTPSAYPPRPSSGSFRPSDSHGPWMPWMPWMPWAAGRCLSRS